MRQAFLYLELLEPLVGSDCLFFTAENRLKHDAESYRYKNIINDRAVIVSGLIGFCDQDSPYRGMHNEQDTRQSAQPAKDTVKYLDFVKQFDDGHRSGNDKNRQKQPRVEIEFA